MIQLPIPQQIIYSANNNIISRCLSEDREAFEVRDIHYLSITPFIIGVNGIKYLLTNNIEVGIPDDCEYALLTKKAPRKVDIQNGTIRFLQWIKHPLFNNISANEIVRSWRNKFLYTKENREENEPGLRAPQLGAIHAFMSHAQSIGDRSIIVMPTGTGKTETMLSILIANQCPKLLIAVPSDALRTQLANKFETLGILKNANVITADCEYPYVATIQTGTLALNEWQSIIEKSNVVITTMDILAGCPSNIKELFSSQFSHLFVDEAHHSAANTWRNVIDSFDNHKVTLFTATPFRNDGKKLQGNFIYNFSLKDAQEQQYYKEINFIPIREYDRVEADRKIAERAVRQLREDIANNFDHILMARCVSKKRAIEVFQYYKDHEDLNPVLVYTGIAHLREIIAAIKEKKHKIIVCVNMLGEGFDLPELKIAAIHDERQSLPITLQFIGRFTRTSYNTLGIASFITNIAYPSIAEELRDLYAKDADWNIILPQMNEAATQREIDFQNFLSQFNGIDASIIPFQNIIPALSTVIYKVNYDTWNTSNWEKGIHVKEYDHYFGSAINDTIVIILGKKEQVDWGNFENIQNATWDMVMVHWYKTPQYNHVYINTSIKGFDYESLINALFGDAYEKIKGEEVFRAFDGVTRLAVMNFGGRKGRVGDVSFQSFYGRGVQDGITLTEQGRLVKNNLFGVGYRFGKKISIGCSISGKIWSYMRGNIKEYIDWCRHIGTLIENDRIDPNIVLSNTLRIQSIKVLPEIKPLSIEWDASVFTHPEHRYKLDIDGQQYDFYEIELNIVNRDINTDILFCIDTDNTSSQFRIEYGEEKRDENLVNYYRVTHTDGPAVTFHCRTKTYADISEFFNICAPSIYFANGAQLFGNNYVEVKEDIKQIPQDCIYVVDWGNTNFRHESQKVAPYVTDSIQYYFSQYILNDYDVVYDDDGSGEIADLIGIKDSATRIDIHLFHLKFAIDGQVSNDINNFYQVCGQAQKSLRWKDKSGKDLFDHLFARITKTHRGEQCSRILKGTEDILEKLSTAAYWQKEILFHINIVQPGLSKEHASNDILLLLGNVHQFLGETGNVELNVYCSQ